MANIIYHNPTITQDMRNKLNNHKSVVIWLTGLSGSGKSTIAHTVEEALYKLDCRTFVLDGDNVRHGLSSNLGFSDEDRKENIRRIGEVSKLMSEAGIIVIAAFISPFESDRKVVRELFAEGEFVEIFCKASLKICESRDVKGLYKCARSGVIKNYTGIDSPYEPPPNPELVINTEHESLERSVDRIMSYLWSNNIINNA